MNTAHPAVGRKVFSQPPSAGQWGLDQSSGLKHRAAPSQAVHVCIGETRSTTVNSAGNSIME